MPTCASLLRGHLNCLSISGGVALVVVVFGCASRVETGAMGNGDRAASGGAADAGSKDFAASGGDTGAGASGGGAGTGGSPGSGGASSGDGAPCSMAISPYAGSGAGSPCCSDDDCFFYPVFCKIPAACVDGVCGPCQESPGTFIGPPDAASDGG